MPTYRESRRALASDIMPLLLLAVCAYAAPLNVPSTYPTIQSAINAAGDTILVAAGTYRASLS